jgi:hypothetical protein
LFPRVFITAKHAGLNNGFARLALAIDQITAAGFAFFSGSGLVASCTLAVAVKPTAAYLAQVFRIGKFYGANIAFAVVIRIAVAARRIASKTAKP